MTAPLIALPGRPVSGRRGVSVPAAYIEAVERAGGHGAVLQPVALQPEEAAERMGRFDGLLLIGGGDVDPSRYGEEPHPSVYGVEALRDEFELALARAAAERGVPTLAICRGMQVLNVALGGTLTQHLGDDERLGHGDPAAHEPVMHAVNLEPGSRVAKAMGLERPDCSSHHHQGLAQLGDGLQAKGWAEDGVVEAVEHHDGWIVGIQWHPEQTCGADPAQQGLFDALVLEAR